MSCLGSVPEDFDTGGHTPLSFVPKAEIPSIAQQSASLNEVEYGTMNRDYSGVKSMVVITVDESPSHSLTLPDALFTLSPVNGSELSR